MRGSTLQRHKGKLNESCELTDVLLGYECITEKTEHGQKQQAGVENSGGEISLG